ncbi:MAG: NADH-quinone oxidoreductase subunit N [Candidatus Saccharibacteria bacterium]
MADVDFLGLTPLMIVALAPMIIMLTVAVRRAVMAIYGFSLLAFVLALLSIYVVIPLLPHSISTLLIIDRVTVVLWSVIILASIAVTILSRDYLLNQESEKEEYFIILFISTLGAMLLVSAINFVSLFLGLETLSISLYVLIAYRRISDQCIEAGIKYLILASVSSAFLLFGMGLIYLDTGSLEFLHIAQTVHSFTVADSLLYMGFGMMIVGLGFKLALVPFHMWTPDIYQGAPTPVATYIATVSKAAVMTVFLRFFYAIDGYNNFTFIRIISVIAILSMFVGNLLALKQQNVKRILAYSSISNMGYLLVTLLVGGENGIQAAIFYIISYLITTLGAFGVITLFSTQQHEAEMLMDYKGLFWKRPWMAFVFTLAMLSLAGIPLTAGFMGKFYIVFEGIHASLWLLVICLIVNSVIGLYYYLRVISVMFLEADDYTLPAVSMVEKGLMGLIAVGIVGIGIFPQWIIQLIFH